MKSSELQNIETETGRAAALLAGIKNLLAGRSKKQIAKRNGYPLLVVSYGEEKHEYKTLSKSARAHLDDLIYYNFTFQALRNFGGGITILAATAGTLRAVQIERGEL